MYQFWGWFNIFIADGHGCRGWVRLEPILIGVIGMASRLGVLSLQCLVQTKHIKFALIPILNIISVVLVFLGMIYT